MNIEDYITTITNYINDRRFKRAVLIDGDWGCGKTYFVKEILMHRLNGTDEYHKSHSNDKTYFTVIVSLYGISSIEAIQTQMYTSFFEAYLSSTIELNNNRIIKKHNRKLVSAVKYTSLFGPTLIKGISSRLGIEAAITEASNQASEIVLSSNKKEIVIIFDDLERCRVDILELMGFLNNLCENNGYKIIIVANEKEIYKKGNEIAFAIQKHSALIDLYATFFNSQQESDNSNRQPNEFYMSKCLSKRNSLSDDAFRNLLDDHNSILFDKKSQYDKTREKLIGLKIRYVSNIEDTYNVILSDTVNNDTEDIIRKQKNNIIHIFNSYNYTNYRTLISIFIALDKILSCINKNLYKDNINEYNSEIDNVCTYITISAIELSLGSLPHKWANNRHGYIVGGFKNVSKIYGYAFVDEYWDTLVINEQKINSDISNCVNRRIEKIRNMKENDEHMNLRLFELNPWYSKEDSYVKESIEKIKEELVLRKYYPKEFKDIICLLMNINKANNEIDKKINLQINHNYDQWDNCNINEFVDLMLKYLESDNSCITKEMLSIDTIDDSFEMKYYEYINPILSRIDEIKYEELISSTFGDDSFDSLIIGFSKNIDAFVEKQEFIAYYGSNIFCRLMYECSPQQLYVLNSTISKVYSSCGYSTFNKHELEELSAFADHLSSDIKNGGTKYNPDKSRTKEINLTIIEKKLREHMQYITHYIYGF